MGDLLASSAFWSMLLLACMLLLFWAAGLMFFLSSSIDLTLLLLLMRALSLGLGGCLALSTFSLASARYRSTSSLRVASSPLTISLTFSSFWTCLRTLEML